MSKAGLDLGNVELSGQSAPNDHRRVAGIKLSTLPRRISRMLSDWSRYIKIRSVGPRALLCQAILHEAHHVCRRKGFAVPFVNRMVVMPRGDGTIGEKWEAVRDMHTIGWKCAYCKLPIRAEVGDLSAANLCCPKCYSKYVDAGGPASREDPIIQSSVDFTDACVARYDEQREYIARYARENTRFKDALLRGKQTTVRGKRISRRQAGTDPLKRQ